MREGLSIPICNSEHIARVLMLIVFTEKAKLRSFKPARRVRGGL